ncbi:MAG: hypothetical protein RXR20_01830 [Paraburkholderia sp.]|jgi:hypothetical protein|uniref:hypothetical protein n=1 Tax=Burkholderiaceae TaxID=119060 RepID=UPI0010F6D01E|nr:hypothetical protein [Burkholderia sp. 4M9327F10]
MTYHAITVTLENINGITAVKDKYGIQTQSLTFNATVSGKRQYAVSLRGEPRLENGMVVTAVLRDPENWQTLIAWFNHSSGQICGVEPPLQPFAVWLFTVLIGIMFFFKAVSANTGTGFRAVLLLAVVGINVWSLLSWIKSVRVYRLLRP